VWSGERSGDREGGKVAVMGGGGGGRGTRGVDGDMRKRGIRD